jgi:hypothetical protein
MSKNTKKWYQNPVGVIIGIVILAAIGSMASHGEQPKQAVDTMNAETPTASNTVNEIKKPKQTPAPTDPCEQVKGTSFYGPCLKSSIPHLNATVKESTQALIVTNNDSVNWEECDYSIGANLNENDFYELGTNDSYSNIPAHETVYVPWSALTKRDGTRFNYYNQQPNDLMIDCSAGGTDAEWRN